VAQEIRAATWRPLSNANPSNYCCGVFTVVLPLPVFPFGPVPVPETVVVPLPLLVLDAVPLAVLPRGPVADPVAVVVLPVFVTVPFSVVVPPFGPVTAAVPVAPVMVFFTVAVPVVVLPPAEVAVPVAVTVFPLRVAELLAVPPRGPVAECCAYAEETPNDSARIKVAVQVFFIKNLLVASFSGESNAAVCRVGASDR